MRFFDVYIHLGADLTVLKKSVIAVINLEEVPPMERNVTEFMNEEDNRGRLQYISDDLPQSVVITDEGTYVTPLSCQVLRKRLQSELYSEM
ncbi:MAG: DUF370 domain-containing protein [Clostridiales bacterium]|nr:DUF370 domain-containing protein [Clostridiales bacterium]